MATTAFRKIQIGQESTRGTGVAATKKLIGALSMTPQIARHRPQDEDGTLAEFVRQRDVGQMSRLSYQGDATFEQIIDFFAMTLKGGVTPSTPDGATDARLWTFTPSITASNAHDSYTVEYGDNTQAWESVFTLAESLSLSVNLDSTLSMSVEMFAHFAAKTTFTSSLDNPSVEEIPSAKLKVYINDFLSSLASSPTQKSDLVTGADISLNSGLVPVKSANGTLEFTGVSERKRSHSMRLDMAVGSDFITEYDAWAAGSLRAVRLEWEGSEIEDGFNKTLTIDMAGRWVSEPRLFTDNEGRNIVSMELVSNKESGGGELVVSVQNDETGF